MSANLRFLIIAVAAAAALLSITTLSRASEISDSGPLDHNHAKNQRQPAAATKYLTVRQDEASIFYLKQMIKISEEGSHERAEAEKELADLISHRKHIDESLRGIVKVLVVNGQINASVSSQLFTIRTRASATDWKCVKTMVANFQAHCGTLRDYGLKCNLLFVNLCDAGVTPHQLDVASLQTCPSHTVNPKWMAEVKFGFYERSF